MTKYYAVVKSHNKADTVPYYLDKVTLSELCAFYFNFHPHAEGESVVNIIKWFNEKKSWSIQEIN